MNLATVLILVGLLFNTVASLVMLCPYLHIKQNVDDDLIEDMDNTTGDYTQRKHLRNRKLGEIGFFLFVVGFSFQIIGIIVGVYR